jgi:hypothetical protein
MAVVGWTHGPGAACGRACIYLAVAECHVRRGRLACEEASAASVAYDRRAV